jgi:hypothetical protein
MLHTHKEVRNRAAFHIAGASTVISDIIDAEGHNVLRLLQRSHWKKCVLSGCVIPYKYYSTSMQLDCNAHVIHRLGALLGKGVRPLMHKVQLQAQCNMVATSYRALLPPQLFYTGQRFHKLLLTAYFSTTPLLFCTTLRKLAWYCAARAAFGCKKCSRLAQHQD